MPEKGWRTITIDEEVYYRAKEFIREYNKATGAKVFRSMAHLVEQAIVEFMKKSQDERKHPS